MANPRKSAANPQGTSSLFARLSGPNIGTRPPEPSLFLTVYRIRENTLGRTFDVLVRQIGGSPSSGRFGVEISEQHRLLSEPLAPTRAIRGGPDWSSSEQRLVG